jgi:hypothetical protein
LKNIWHTNLGNCFGYLIPKIRKTLSQFSLKTAKRWSVEFGWRGVKITKMFTKIATFLGRRLSKITLSPDYFHPVVKDTNKLQLEDKRDTRPNWHHPENVVPRGSRRLPILLLLSNEDL